MDVGRDGLAKTEERMDGLSEWGFGWLQKLGCGMRCDFETDGI